jgi:carbon monoxide dehydrogenase subunit G
MTVRVKRTFDLPVEPQAVWAFLVDPAKRAGAISVVESYEVHDETRGTWHVSLPIPLVDRTVAVETEDVVRDPPKYVKFVGRSAALRVTGEHTIEATPDGCRLINEFVVEGRIPGVESFFKRNLDRELNNLEDKLRETLDVEEV